MKLPQLIPVLITLATILLFGWVAQTIGAVYLFVPGVIISYIAFLYRFRHKAPDPDQLLPWYLLALGIQLLHFLEEYLTDFTSVMPRLVGDDPYPMDFWVTFNLVAYFVFTVGGIIIYKRWREWMIIPLFFILVAVVFNGVGHLGLALYVRGYFPGFFTALIYLVIGPILLKRL